MCFDLWSVPTSIWNEQSSDSIRSTIQVHFFVSIRWNITCLLLLKGSVIECIYASHASETESGFLYNLLHFTQIAFWYVIHPQAEFNRYLYPSSRSLHFTFTIFTKKIQNNSLKYCKFFSLKSNTSNIQVQYFTIFTLEKENSSFESIYKFFLNCNSTSQHIHSWETLT